MRSAALLSAIGDDHVARVFENIRRNKLSSSSNQSRNLRFAEGRNFAEWIYLFNEANFGFEDISNSREYCLVKQHVTNLFA